MADELPGHDKFCRHCGYDLYGLSENRCPECGNTFDPNDPQTFLKHARPESRRWWRKCIGMLLAVLILQLAIGACSLWWHWHREQPAVKMVQRCGGQWLTQTTGPLWLQRLLGHRGRFLLARMWSISLDHSNVTDADLEHLKDLTGLQGLGLGGTKVTDAGLEHLKGLTGLADLGLSNTQVTDAGLQHLKDLTGLQNLDLSSTQVTDAGLEHLKGLTGLRELDLSGTNVTDAGLKHLKALTGLRWLVLRRAKVTNAGMVELQEALPGCGLER